MAANNTNFEYLQKIRGDMTYLDALKENMDDEIRWRYWSHIKVIFFDTFMRK